MAAWTNPSRADEIDDAAAKFGARPTVLDLGISPLGDKIFIVGTRADGGDNAVVVDLKTKDAVPVMSVSGGKERLTNCQFVLEDRLVCGVYLLASQGAEVTAGVRLATISTDGKVFKPLSARSAMNSYYTTGYGGDIIDYNVDGNSDAVLMTRWVTPQETSSSRLSRDDQGLTVEAVDLKSLKRTMLERPRDTAVDYITDGKGHLRLMATQPTNSAGYARRVVNYFVRGVDGGDWQPLSSTTFDSGVSTGFQPVAVDPGKNVIYGFDTYQGSRALFEMPATPGATPKVLLSEPNIDVDGLIRIGRDQRVVGATYATDRRLAEYFDPELGKLAKALGHALPGDPGITFVDSSQDESKLVLFVGSDVNPGSYYLFDKQTKQLSPIMGVRENLAGVKLATMTAVNFPAADGTMIPAYLTLPPGSDGKNLPAIVMPHGGPSSRDEWGFDWLVQYFATQGYAVLQPNYRGSAGYGTKWFEKNGFQSWQTAIGDVDDAGRWLVKQGIAAPGKLAIVGWSYGGYAALQSQVLDPDLYKAVVAIAPVTDLDSIKEEARNQSNYRVVENFVGTGPHIEAGSPARHADRFKAPVLLFHGDLDLNVAVGESRLMDDRLKAAGKSVQYIEFKDLDHQLDNGDARAKLLSTSDRFLRKAFGMN